MFKRVALIATVFAFSQSCFAMSETYLTNIRQRITAKYPEKSVPIISTGQTGLEEGANTPQTKPKSDEAFCFCWAKCTYDANTDVAINGLRKKLSNDERTELLE
jgi:hypothetical protein